MPSAEEKRRVLYRLLAITPFEGHSSLWIYLVWLCFAVRGEDNQPDFKAIEEETGFSVEFIENGFHEMKLFALAIRALADLEIKDLTEEEEDN